VWDIAEILVDVAARLFMSGEDREWSIPKICAALAVVIVLGVLAFVFLR
jgi:hypothetical protein